VVLGNSFGEHPMFAALGQTAPSSMVELVQPLKGFKVRLMFQDQAPDIGSGNRLVIVQFRGKKVTLHCAGCTQAIKRDVFHDVILVNQRYRKGSGLKRHRCPKLELVVSAHDDMAMRWPVRWCWPSRRRRRSRELNSSIRTMAVGYAPGLLRFGTDCTPAVMSWQIGGVQAKRFLSGTTLLVSR
jgi:hypothetical protein